jgi:hypothetical protein
LQYSRVCLLNQRLLLVSSVTMSFWLRSTCSAKMLCLYSSSFICLIRQVYSSCLVTCLQRACRCLLLICSLLLSLLLLSSLTCLVLLISASIRFTVAFLLLSACRAVVLKGLELAFLLPLTTIILTKLKVYKGKKD